MTGISIFMYHQVGRFPAMRSHQASYCDIGRFRRQMRAIRTLGATVISMSQAEAALRGEVPTPDRAVVLSFDDGYDSFYDHVLPVLSEMGYPSIVYAIAGLAGSCASWLAADGHPTPPLMSMERLREVASCGVEIGSHALSHVRLAGQPVERQRDELRSSRDRLQQGLGQAVRHVCYPYGSHDRATLRLADEAGYRTGVTCQRGAATPEFDLMALPRKAVSQGDNLIGFLWKLYAKDAAKGIALRRSDAGSASVSEMT